MSGRAVLIYANGAAFLVDGHSSGERFNLDEALVRGARIVKEIPLGNSGNVVVILEQEPTSQGTGS